METIKTLKVNYFNIIIGFAILIPSCGNNVVQRELDTSIDGVKTIKEIEMEVSSHFNHQSIDTVSISISRYNEQGKLTQVEVYDIGGLIAKEEHVYQGNKEIIKEFLYDKDYVGGESDEPLVSSITYNERGKPIVSESNGSITHYEYNKMGDIVTEESSSGSIKTYTYNELHLLIHEEDKKGDWITKTDYIYDDNNRLVQSSFIIINTVEGRGSSGGTHFFYNGDGKLLAEESEGGDYYPTKTQYEYDGKGRKVKRLYSVNGTLSSITEYQYEMFL